MTNRPKFYKDLTGAPDYNVNYSLIDVKPRVVLFEKKRVDNTQSHLTSTRTLNHSTVVDLPAISARQSKDFTIEDFINKQLVSSQDFSLKNSHLTSRLKLKLLNKELLEMEKRGENLEKEVKEEIDEEKEYINSIVSY